MKKHILSYSYFIGEGAFTLDSIEVILEPKDDPKNPHEVLKSSSGGIGFLGDTPATLKRPETPGFPVYYGLSVDDYQDSVDHLGRFKYTMDLLKSGKIKDADNALRKFIQYSFKSLGIEKNFMPDYVVTLGSTSGLVGMLGDVIKNSYSTGERPIELINLPKVKYLNAGDAVDWDELALQVERQTVQTIRSFTSNLLSYIDKKETSRNLIGRLRNSQSVEELKSLIINGAEVDGKLEKVVWLSTRAEEQMLPFIVRSSGRNFGGLRKFFKPKYDTNSADFIAAAVDCLSSTKKMLIIDDNKNTGEDIKTIKKNLDEIIEATFDPSTFSFFDKFPQTRFGFYVLYKIQPNSSFRYTGPDNSIKTNFPISASDMKSFSEYIENKK